MLQKQFGKKLLAHLYDANPNLIIYTHQSVASILPGLLPVHIVETGDVINAESFELEFFGNKHAIIHNLIPQINNLGLMINNNVYYPGDSFTNPERPVKTLLLPVSAPWMKVSESIDFLNSLNPSIAIPTHDAILSDAGKQIVDGVISKSIRTNTKKYQRITSPLVI